MIAPSGASITPVLRFPLIAFRKYLQYERGTYDDNGVFTPANKGEYKRVLHIKVPASPSDPLHWGHLAWLFCEYMESFEA